MMDWSLDPSNLDLELENEVGELWIVQREAFGLSCRKSILSGLSGVLTVLATTVYDAELRNDLQHRAQFFVVNTRVKNCESLLICFQSSIMVCVKVKPRGCCLLIFLSIWS